MGGVGLRLVLPAGNGCSPPYTALCISIKANGTKQNPITGEQTGGLSAAPPPYCFNHGANGAFGATGMLSEKHVSPTFQGKRSEMKIQALKATSMLAKPVMRP